MKKIIFLAILFGSMLSIKAQKVIEKHFDFSQKKVVSLNIQIADSIRVITWNKNEVYVKLSVDVNDNKNNDNYKVVFGEPGDVIAVNANFEFEKGKNGCGTSNNCNCNCISKIYCDVYVPENAPISVETINGNITITGKTSGIRAHSISGFIDLAITPERKADLKMNTISGTMYSDFDLLQGEKNMRHIGGNSISARLNGGGGEPIDIETISGDIFFRKAS